MLKLEINTRKITIEKEPGCICVNWRLRIHANSRSKRTNEHALDKAHRIWGKSTTSVNSPSNWNTETSRKTNPDEL